MAKDSVNASLSWPVAQDGITILNPAHKGLISLAVFPTEKIAISESNTRHTVAFESLKKIRNVRSDSKANADVLHLNFLDNQLCHLAKLHSKNSNEIIIIWLHHIFYNGYTLFDNIHNCINILKYSGVNITVASLCRSVRY